jgi:type III pantothenate kinase
MHRAAVDIGNTRIKCALFDDAGHIREHAVFTLIPEVMAWLSQQGAGKVMVSSVGRHKLPAMQGVKIYNLSYETKTPFTNLYGTPETLGVDRIAAMAAACSMYPGIPVLVFDIGTCMTIDLMHASKVYKGGNISPGLGMRLKAMHTMTDKLPYASVEDVSDTAGNSTKNALANGALWGMKYEIEGYIAHYLSLYPDLSVVICGGDFSHFDKQLKYKIFAAPDFVLQGLYHLLLLNEK